MQARGAGPAVEVSLPERLVVSVVDEVHGRLTDALANTDSIHVDGRGVRQVDAAGLQLLLALARSAASRGRLCRLTGSPALGEGARLLGLTAALGLVEARAEEKGGQVGERS